MEIFISWSGEVSKHIAQSLKDWLPLVINAVEPWLSDGDIQKGERWNSVLAAKLETATIGIICLTQDNLNSPWILFESGAISKKVASAFVCPLLIGLEPSDVAGPLASFQLTRSNKQDMKKLVRTINYALGSSALPEKRIEVAFEVCWPNLEERILNLPQVSANKRALRSDREILDEVLALSRGNARTVRSAMTDFVQTWLLFPFVANVGGADTLVAIANISHTPFGTKKRPGNIEINYYGSHTPAKQHSTVAVEAGETARFTLSGGGTHGVAACPGFQGFLIVVCNFPACGVSWTGPEGNPLIGSATPAMYFNHPFE